MFVLKLKHSKCHPLTQQVYFWKAILWKYLKACREELVLPCSFQPRLQWKRFRNNLNFLPSAFKDITYKYRGIPLLLKRKYVPTYWRESQGLPWRLSKESACQCGRPRFDPWSGKIPWRRKWQPTPVFLPMRSRRVGHDLVTEQQQQKDSHNLLIGKQAIKCIQFNPFL